MTPHDFFKKINENFDEIEQKTAKGQQLVKECVQVHPADTAEFLSNSSLEHFDILFSQFSTELQQKIFEYLSNSLRAQALRIVEDKQKLVFLEHMSMDDISDLVDFADAHELKHYFSLLHHKDRERIVELLKLKSNAVGTVMDFNVVSLHQNFTVERGVQILRQLEPEQELHRTIYLTNAQNQLVGQIWLEDLVLKSPQTVLNTFMRPIDLIVQAEEDQEDVAIKMRHYELTSAPVVGENNKFLGAVTDKTLVDILEEEAGEDILRISAVPGIKHTYFETPFFMSLFNRGSILFVLMFMESIVSYVMDYYEPLLAGTLTLFVTTLLSTGGNASTQTSALVIQGVASGEINSSNAKRFLRQELIIAFCLSLILGLGAFFRVLLTPKGTIVAGVTVGLSIGVVVMVAVLLGSAVPFVLKRLGIDPAYAAGPFLTTAIDIIGIFLFCQIAKVIYYYFVG